MNEHCCNSLAKAIEWKVVVYTKEARWATPYIIQLEYDRGTRSMCFLYCPFCGRELTHYESPEILVYP